MIHRETRNRPPDDGLTRRGFLQLLGSVGGTGLMLSAMEAWGMGIASAQTAPPQLDDSGKGKRVVILGAGPAGMTAAYELGKYGYETPILEARPFAGGRVQSIRNGSVRTQLDGHTQVCHFRDGGYLNNGPWRIPHYHFSTLHYTKEFDIPIQVFINENIRGYVVFDDVEGPLSGKRLRRGHIQADMRGHAAEILAKSAHQDKLAVPFSKEDREELIAYLEREAALNPDTLSYTGIPQLRGYEVWPTTKPGEGADPYGFLDLLHAGLGNILGYVNQEGLMFQPVGGMDRIAVGFERAVGHNIRYNTEVTEIRQSDDGVRISYKDTKTGELGQTTGDYCFCTIPFSVLMRIPNDLSPDRQRLMRMVSYAPVGKMGLQFKRRFWETDDMIYGGHSVTNREIRQISYPNYNWQGKTGVIQGYYDFDGPHAIKISRMTPEERLQWAVKQGSVFHPDTYEKEFDSGFSFFWHLEKYNRGGWGDWTVEGRKEAYPVLLEPDNRIYLAGEHLSYINAWIAGAIESSWAQLKKLHDHAAKEGQS